MALEEDRITFPYACVWEPHHDVLKHGKPENRAQVLGHPYFAGTPLPPPPLKPALENYFNLSCQTLPIPELGMLFQSAPTPESLF